MNPAIMLFDEPTSALDPELAYEVFEAIEDLAHDGLTMIIVTHQVNLVKEFANRIVFMDHGQIRADGTTEEIISSTDLRLKRFLKRITVA
jgi:polar amino acid transport system ATP-binding protein